MRKIFSSIKFVGNVFPNGLGKNTEDDIISILLQDKNYQNTEDIIDDIFSMYFDGVMTVQATTTNTITSLMFNPECLAKMRAETDPVMNSIKDKIMKKLM